MTHRVGKLVIECQPVRAPRGTVTHALSPTESGETACGTVSIGWLAGTEPVDCERCKKALLREAVRRQG